MIPELSLVMFKMKFIKRDKDHSYLDYIYSFRSVGPQKTKKIFNFYVENIV